MTIKELHKELLEAYSVSNLNTISLTLINLFRSRQYPALQKIAGLISDYVNIRISDDGKGFSKFMMLYHPDRAVYYMNEINRLREQNNYDGLLAYSHIFRLEKIEEIASNINSYEDIDYSPVYEWDEWELNEEGFSIIDMNTSADVWSRQDNEQEGYSFYDALKLRAFGRTNVEYPSYYLEDTEEFELSYCSINDLDGVQLCTHVRFLDLSNNRISDLFPLIGLRELEELNLSDNQVGFIDDISNLKKLKSVRLSNNYIEDISPLFELTELEYVDVSGNKIEPEQVSILEEMGVMVDFD
jgi:Leucine-rich repeat (LRR) protein